MCNIKLFFRNLNENYFFYFQVIANVKGFHKSPRLDIPITIGVPGPITDLSYNFSDHSQQLLATDPLSQNSIPHVNKM